MRDQARGHTLMIGVGSWGGVYFYRGFTTRLCLGWLAITYIPLDDSWIAVTFEYDGKEARDG